MKRKFTTIILSEQQILALESLAPDCAPKNPMRGKWDRDDEVTQTRRELWAMGLLDNDGNHTVLATRYLKALAEREADDIAFYKAAEEAFEMDVLDHLCRRRPSHRRTAKHYYSDDYLLDRLTEDDESA